MAVFTDNNLYPGRIDTAMPGFVGNSILSYSYTSASAQNDAKYYFVYKNTNYYFLVSAAAGDHTIMFDVPSKKIFLDSKDNEIQLVNPQSTTGYTLITLSNSSTVRVHLDITNHNSINDIKAGAYLQVSLRYQTSNENALSDSSGIAFKTLTQESGTKYYFDLNASDLADGVFYTYEYYKLQFRFTDSGATDYSSGSIDTWLATKNQGGKTNLDNSSEWSTVCLIRQISDFDLQVEGWAAGGTSSSPTQVSLPSLYDISGFIKFDEMPPGDSEYLKSIQIIWANKDSGVIYTDSYGNSYNKFKYDFRYNFIAGNAYNIKITATTNTLYIKDFYYTVTIDAESQTLNFNPEISYDTSEEEGLIKMHLDYESNYDANTLNIYRTCAKDNYTNKEKIYSGELKNEENPEYISGTGESISLNGTAEGKMIIDLYGNTSQETTVGYNIINFDVTQTSANVTVNDDGTLTINGAGGFSIKFNEITLESGKTYVQHLEVVSGSLSAGDINYSFMSFDAYNQFYLNTNFADEYHGDNTQRNSLWVNRASTFNNLRVKIWAYEKTGTDSKPFEKATNGPSPNPDYPQIIHSVSGDNEINIATRNLLPTDKTLWESGHYNTSGDKSAFATRMRTINLIPCLPNTNYYVLGSNFYIREFNTNKTFINNAGTVYSTNTFTTSENTYYLGISVEITYGDYVEDTNKIAIFYNSETDKTWAKGILNTYPLYLGVENLWNENTQVFTNQARFDNPTKDSNNKWTFTSNSSGYAYAQSSISLPAGTYRFSLVCTGGDTLLQKDGVTITNPFTITETSTIVFRVYKSNASQGDVVTLEKVQLVKGTKPQHTSTQPITLNKIGNYQDKIVKTDKWYWYREIGEYVANNDLTANGSSDDRVDLLTPELNIQANIQPGDFKLISFCNLMMTFAQSSDYGTGLAGTTPSKKIRVQLAKHYGVSDFATANTFLKNKGFIIYYVLETPTYTEITDSTLISQLETAWYSQDKQTNISQINNDKAFIINANVLDSSAIQMSTDYNDYSIESGILYKYSFQIENNKNNNKSAEKTTSPNNPIGIVFDHAYLKHGNQQLKIKYNPQISSMKTTYSENKTETIGSQFPFIRRNAAVKYRTFPISGLISYFMDEEGHLFSSREYEYGNNLNDYNTFNNNNGITYLTDYTYERLFRDRVRDFLEDGEVKLFKSPTEGNILVRLMDVNFSPNQTNGRMIWTFSATAYEMAEATIKNMEEYNIIPADIENNFGIDNYNNQIVTTTRMPHVDGEVYDDEDSVPWSV